MPIVRRGSPISRNVGPLQGMSFPTVEGRLNLGYLRGGRGGRNGIGLLLPIDPTVPIPNTVPRKATVHGIGAFTRGRGLSGVAISGPGGASTSFRVGDAYTISITGGAPNAPVYGNMSQCSPDFSRCAQVPMSGQADIALSNWMGKPMTGNEPNGIGMTDGSGNFSMSGTFTPAMVGMWTQNWHVGSQQVGGAQFTVSDGSGSAAYGGAVTPGGTPYYTLAQNNVPTQPAPAPVVQTLAQQLSAKNEMIAPTGQLVPLVAPTAAASGAPATVNSGSAGGSISDLVSGFSLSSIPTWGWIAAAGVGALLLFGGGKHHG